MKSVDLSTAKATDADGDGEYSEAAEGLLNSEEKNPRWETRRHVWFSGKRALAFHALVFVLYLIPIVGLAVELSRTRAKLRREFLQSPATGALEWSIQEFNSGDGLHGDFIGHPRPVLEKAWKELLAPMNVRLRYEDIVAFDRQDVAVALSDGSGYAGSLNVYHELHCVRWLHKYVWQDIYWPDKDENQRKIDRSHSDHCLEDLRKSAMCHGDVGTVVYSWDLDTSKPGANATAHQCVNWPKLHQWSEGNSFSMYEPGLIVHPKFGALYPNGDPDKIDD